VNFDETEEGLLGLTRSTDHEYDMLIDKLHKSGKISSKIFAVFMDYGSSSIQIGDYDLSYVKEPTVPIQYINLMDKTMFWNVPVKAI
jgi:hypothetical protein